MRFVVIHLLFLIGATATAQDGLSETEQQESLGHVRAAMTSEEAAGGVMDAVAAVRKIAHGDGTDSWANKVEESVLDLEEEKHAMEQKQKERQARHEKERQALHAQHEKEMQALRARHAEHMRALHQEMAAGHAKEPETAEEAARKVMEGAEAARKKAHGDGSDRFANSLEESILDLQAMDAENKRKQAERHALHEKERQALHARHEQEMQALRARHEEEIAVHMPTTPITVPKSSAQQAGKADATQQLKELITEEKEQNQELKQLITVEKKESEKFRQDEDDESEEEAWQRPAWQVGLFLVIGVFVGLHLSNVMHIPGVPVVRPPRWVKASETMIPLKPLAGAGTYGGLTM